MKKEIAFYLRRIGPALLVIGLAVMISLSISFPAPGSWTQSMATPDNPLRGFWIAWGIFAVALLGLIMWLFSLSVEENIR